MHMFSQDRRRSLMVQPRQSNYVTTRQRGVIPGCVPAVDVLVEFSAEEMREKVLKGCERYLKILRDWQDGVIGFAEFKNHPIHNEVAVKVIRSPSPKPYVNHYAT